MYVGTGEALSSAISVNSDRAWTIRLWLRIPGARRVDSEAIRLSHEFVPLSVSSVRNRTDVSRADSRVWRTRSTSARNFDLPSRMESGYREGGKHRQVGEAQGACLREDDGQCDGAQKRARACHLRSADDVKTFFGVKRDIVPYAISTRN
jgi:hypothetical protein